MSTSDNGRRAVLVIGAEEFIASRLTDILASNSSYRAITPMRIATRNASPHHEIRHCDVTRADHMVRALDGVDTVVNCISGAPQSIIGTTKALCEAARRNPPRRIILVSSMAVYGGALGIVDETTKPEPPLNGYAKARIESEALVQQYVTDGGDAVIIRPSCIFGPGSEPWAARIARLLTSRRLGDLGELGDGVCNLVHVDDLANMIITMFSASGVSGETFNASADWPRPTWNEFLSRFARAIGATPVERLSARRLQVEVKILAPLLRGIALIANPLRAGRSIPDAVTPSLVRLFRQDITVSSAKARDRFGITHVPLDAAIDTTAHWWSSRQPAPAPARSPTARGSVDTGSDEPRPVNLPVDGSAVGHEAGR
jgi:nucleoside-diphosphate-sugar epimerase